MEPGTGHPDPGAPARGALTRPRWPRREGAAAQPPTRDRGPRSDDRGRPPRAARPQPRVGAGHRGRRARDPRRHASPTTRRSRSAPSSRVGAERASRPARSRRPAPSSPRASGATLGMKCRVCRGAGRHRPSPAQRELLSRALRRALRGAGAACDQALRHDPAGRARARRGLRRQGLARAVGPAHPPRLPGRRPLHRSRHRRVLRRVGALRARRTPSRGASPSTSSTSPPTTASRSRAPPRPPDVRRAVRAGSRSATSSTRSRSSTATTSCAPVTTSTTRPRCCSATSCTGTSTTSPASTPRCPAAPGFARKVKPLYRLGEREMAAYCVLERIDYQVEECPMAEGNRHIGYKETLNDLEARSPGSKAAFLFGFLERAHDALAARRRRRAASSCTRARAAARRPRARCARSVGCASGRSR